MSGFRDWKFYNGEVRDSSGQLELGALRRHVRALEVKLDELSDENERLRAERRGLAAALGAMGEEQKRQAMDKPVLEFPEHRVRCGMCPEYEHRTQYCPVHGVTRTAGAWACDIGQRHAMESTVEWQNG